MIDGKANKTPLFDCAFPTQTYGWVVGSGGLAAQTQDGGKTWQRVETGAEGIKEVVLTRVVFPDQNHGWITGEGGFQPSDFPVQREVHQIGFLLKYIP